MTNEEFSNAFDTLINAYKHKSEFGDQASIADISLDEYEKSIFLTQAQDNIVKSYFTRTLNSNGEGFDDSTRRQMDFSTLITVKKIDISSAVKGDGFSDEGYVVSFEDENFKEGITSAYPLFIINEKVVTALIAYTYIQFTDEDRNNAKAGDTFYTPSTSEGVYVEHTIDESTLAGIKSGGTPAYKQITTITGRKNYVVVPLNYKEYDRMMSKAYSEPLKRQAWRLFESSSTDLSRQSEIILRTDANTPYEYVVRYVRRPRPIVLVDLTDTANALTIEGVSTVTECELNPIVHQEILQEAVRLALISNGIETAEVRQAREQANRQNR